MPREFGRHHPVLEDGILDLRPLRAGDDRLGEVLIVEEVADALLVTAQERIHLFYAVDVDTGGPDQRQGSQASRIADREIRGDPRGDLRETTAERAGRLGRGRGRTILQRLAGEVAGKLPVVWERSRMPEV